MTIEQTNVVDIVSLDKEFQRVYLTISDHLEWSRPSEHLLLLQQKINAYLRFIESGEIFERYPDARNKTVEIRVVFKFKPDSTAIEFLDRVEKIVNSAGFHFKTELFGASYDN